MVVSRLAGPGQLSDTSHAEGGSLSRAHVSSRQPFLPKCLDERVMRRCIAQNLSRVIVHPTLNPQDLVFAHVADWAALGDETANQLVLVFARPALPGSIGVAEVDVCHILQGIVQSRELRAVVRGNRLEQLAEVRTSPFSQLSDRLVDRFGILPGQLQNDLEACLPFHQRQQHGIRLGLVSYDRVDFPMAEGFPGTNRLRALFNGFP